MDRTSPLFRCGLARDAGGITESDTLLDRLSWRRSLFSLTKSYCTRPDHLAIASVPSLGWSFRSDIPIFDDIRLKVRGKEPMIHYSCDRCQRLIETDDEMRYVVRLEIEARMGENVFADQDEERDHLLELHEIIERRDDENEPLVDDEVYSRKRFDLCPSCYKAFMRNPMGQETIKSVDFSQN